MENAKNANFEEERTKNTNFDKKQISNFFKWLISREI